MDDGKSLKRHGNLQGMVMRYGEREMVHLHCGNTTQPVTLEVLKVAGICTMLGLAAVMRPSFNLLLWNGMGREIERYHTEGAAGDRSASTADPCALGVLGRCCDRGVVPRAGTGCPAAND